MRLSDNISSLMLQNQGNIHMWSQKFSLWTDSSVINIVIDPSYIHSSIISAGTDALRVGRWVHGCFSILFVLCQFVADLCLCVASDIFT